MEKGIERILIPQEGIQVRYKELGKELTGIYQNTNPLVVGVLKGAMPFTVDTVRSIDTYLELGFMDVSSYRNAAVSSGRVRIVKDLDTSVEDRSLLIAEDIIDSGRTLAYLMGPFKYRKAKSVKIVTLPDKPEGRVVNIEAGYVGFNIPNKFVVGCGLGYAEVCRSLPYISVLKPSAYQPN